MITLAMLRHGATDWNAERRLQGLSDRPLSAAGERQAAAWRLPDGMASFDWYTSPLQRARRTAELLHLEATVDPALTEMRWGEWEGLTLAQVEAKYGEEYGRRTAMGLDLHPHGGETPRDVRTRLADWLRTIAGRGRAAGAVTHKGVLRAALSLATGWDMTDEPPYKMKPNSVHLFAVSTTGDFAIEQLNISLERP